MTHPIVALQGALVAALRETPGLKVFDAPPGGQEPPYVVIVRHDLRPRDGDDAPGHEHRVLMHGWAAEASRKAALVLAEQVVTVALALDVADLAVTLRRHDRTETAIDGKTGRARAAIALTFYSEPN
jgi:hypothetical protein